MPDITMCYGVTSDNIVCKKKDKCYRFTAKPSEFRQSYFMFAPLILDAEGPIKQECEYFWEYK